MNELSPDKSPVNNKAIYDENWTKWEKMKQYGPVSRHVRRLAFNCLDNYNFSSVLDVGCGTGVFLRELLSRYGHLEACGIDLSRQGIELARKVLPEADLFVHDIVAGPLDRQFDLVTMIDVAEHIEDDVSAFKNIRKICKEYFLVITLEGRMRSFEPEVGHVRNYQKGELDYKLNCAGFRTIRTLNWGWPIYSPLYRNHSTSCHRQGIEAYNSILLKLAYWFLMISWPNKGDLVVMISEPA